MAQVPYEILVRLYRGQTHAHVRYLIVDGDVEAEGPTLPLALGGPEFNEFKSQFNSANLQAIASLQSQVEQLQQEKTTLLGTIAGLESDKENLQTQVANLEVELAAAEAEVHSLKNPPVNRRKIPVYAFLERLTNQEQIAITMSDDVQVQIIEKRLLARSVVDLDLQRTRDSIAYFVSKNLLTQERATAILVDATDQELAAD